MVADGQPVISKDTGSNQTLFAQFNFSQSGPQGPFQPAKIVCAPIVSGTSPNPVFTSVTSEDDLDDDDNDSYLTVIDLNTSDKSLDVKAKGSFASL